MRRLSFFLMFISIGIASHVSAQSMQVPEAVQPKQVLQKTLREKLVAIQPQISELMTSGVKVLDALSQCREQELNQDALIECELDSGDAVLANLAQAASLYSEVASIYQDMERSIQREQVRLNESLAVDVVELDKQAAALEGIKTQVRSLMAIAEQESLTLEDRMRIRRLEIDAKAASSIRRDREVRLSHGLAWLKSFEALKGSAQQSAAELELAAYEANTTSGVLENRLYTLASVGDFEIRAGEFNQMVGLMSGMTKDLTGFSTMVGEIDDAPLGLVSEPEIRSIESDIPSDAESRVDTLARLEAILDL